MKNIVLTLMVFVVLVALSFSIVLAEGKKEAPEKKEAEMEEELILGCAWFAPVGDMGWTYAHDEGRAKVVAKYPWVKSVVREGVSMSDMYTVTSTMIEDQGADIVIMNSAAYIDVAQEVARDYPDVMVVYTEGFKQEYSNVAYYFGAIYQPTYLSGLLAGALTKTNKIGLVSPIALPQNNMRLNAFAIGALEANPDADVVVKWTNSWFDPPTEVEVASSLIAEGCDVIAQFVNSPAAVTTAAEKKVWSFGCEADMSKFGIGTDDKIYHVTAPLWDFSVVYEKMIMDYRAGVNKVDYWGDMSDGMVYLSPLSPDAPIPSEVMELVERRKQEIIDGTFKVFHGPLYRWDNNKLMVPEGEVLSLEKIRHIDWFVKGIITEIP